MQFEQPTYAQPSSFGYPQGAYAYPSPQQGMPRPAQPFYDASYGLPTPAPSPRASSSSRRRSNTQEYMGAEYVKTSRPSSSSRRSGDPHAYSEFDGRRSTTSPRPGTSHSHGRTPQPFGVYTPLHTPPPSSHAHHGMPNIHAYGGFQSGPQGDYVSPSYRPPIFIYHSDGRRSQMYPGEASTSSRRYQRPSAHPRTSADSYFPQFHAPSYTPAPGPQSPPPHERRSSSRSHHRSATYSGESSPRSPTRSGSAKPAPPPRANTDSATIEAEARRRKADELKIPSDYSLKNWDPNERPVILLGSVFDPNSLGEWIFNWTKFHHGRTHEATRTAGGLWEMLIELSSKLRRAQDFHQSIRTQENREIVEDFIESGERLWNKLKNLLKSCEEYMWTGARRVTSPKHQEGKTKVQMGKQSGAEFVDAMFNGEKEWENTERLLRGMATWCQRFRVNCEGILMRPDA